MERPKKHEKPIVEFAAFTLAEEIVKRWDHGGDVDQWAHLLIKERSSWSNGYELAKRLDDWHHISPDLELIEILDMASYYLDEAHEDALKKWVKMTSWIPTFVVDQRVVCNQRGKPKEGRINGIKNDVGQLLFVPDDEAAKFAQGGGWVVTEDSLTAIEDIAA